MLKRLLCLRSRRRPALRFVLRFFACPQHSNDTPTAYLVRSCIFDGAKAGFLVIDSGFS